MRRFGLPLALFILAAAIPAQEKDKEKEKEKPSLPSIYQATPDGKHLFIRWRGQSMFEITTTKGTRIVTDPHNIEAYRIKDVKADLILVSHPHVDHNKVDVIDNYKKAKVIQAVKEGNTDWNIVKEEFKDVKIQTVGTYHDKVRGMQRGFNGIFVLEVDGLRIVHLGDLGHELTEAQLKRIGSPVDIIMVPAGGTYTMNGLEAAQVIEQIKPTRYIIPMHYGTLVYDYLLDLKKSGFMGEMKPELVKRYPIDKNAAPNELKIDPKAAAPKEPEVSLLHYSPFKGIGD